MQLKDGEVNFIWSEEEFDWVMRERAQQLVVLEASLTWCRPCKGFERAFQVQNRFLEFQGHVPTNSISQLLKGSACYPVRLAVAAFRGQQLQS